MSVIETGHKMTWEWRAKVDWFFPTPPLLPSYKYAHSESGEVADADVDNERPDDVRNDNGKHRDVNAELAQLTMMLYTALGTNPNVRWADYEPQLWTTTKLSRLAVLVATAWDCAEEGDFLESEDCALAALQIIAARLQDDFLPLLEVCFADIESKRKPAEVNA